MDGPNACNRIHGVLTATGRNLEWLKAYGHIRAHFRPDHNKPSHTLFDSRYRNEEAVKDLIKRAVSHASSIKPTTLTIDGSPGGEPATKIVRHFAQQIGDAPDLDCLLVIADRDGGLVTAYPCTKKDL